ncbi:MAG: 2Fe-2S iron-sulfur cluster-binding protein, partial [Candidatus Aminicenantes bacterium]|nr:2Fe-2S iron-sulfur cluster-binding protein [Candidatus Aminicenantes bacterium]
MVKLKINGRDIAAASGSTVLEAAQAHGIRIPNLCASKGLTPYGGCRLCLVEVKGKRGYLPACCTVVEEGLEVTTDTPRLQALRRQTLELILSEHPHACLICSEKKDCEEYKSTIRKVGEVTGCVLCSENGRCDLQDVVTELKVERVRWPASYRDFEVHREDPFFDRNYNLCILCARCVRVCSEVRGAAAISVVYRGPRAAVGT